MEGLPPHQTPSALLQGTALASPGLDIKLQGNSSLCQHLLGTARVWHTRVWLGTPPPAIASPPLLATTAP